MKNSYQDLCNVFQGHRRTTLENHLVKHYEWSTAKANRAVTQYLMFLFLASEQISEQISEQVPELISEKMPKKTTVSLIPTADIDCVWEADILQNTAQYMQLCHNLCGTVIHHVNGEEIEKLSDFENIETVFSQTQVLFTQRFGHEALGENPSPMAACGVLIRPGLAIA